MNYKRMVKKINESKMEGKRGRGRPQLTLKNTVINALKNRAPM